MCVFLHGGAAGSLYRLFTQGTACHKIPATHTADQPRAGVRLTHVFDVLRERCRLSTLRRAPWVPCARGTRDGGVGLVCASCGTVATIFERKTRSTQSTRDTAWHSKKRRCAKDERDVACQQHWNACFTQNCWTKRHVACSNPLELMFHPKLVGHNAWGLLWRDARKHCRRA